MFVKKYKNNNYILGGGMWVRDFTKPSTTPLDINDITEVYDYELLVNNEIKNRTLSLAPIDDQKMVAKNVVIVSDGYKFDKKQFLLNKLPQDTVIFAVNKTLKKWKANTADIKEGRKNINAYIVNNPYPSCINYVDQDQKYFPACICSARTNHQFVKKYAGKTYEYVPTSSLRFSSNRQPVSWTVDDYRNPICAAINMSYHFGVRKLLLLCCDDSFNDYRPGSMSLPNGLWQYPQQVISHGVVDACLYWLTHQEDYKVVVKSHSSGEEYVNASYINENEVTEFFDDK